MRLILEQLLRDFARQQSVAICRVVETRGSTPQKAGATMLLYPSGEQLGTLGGGCVEAEVKRRALVLLAENRSELCTFQLDNDYGWDDGLICGGRMRVLVEPLASQSSQTYFQTIAQLSARGIGFTEIIVWDRATVPTENLAHDSEATSDTAARTAAITVAVSDDGEILASTSPLSSLPTNTSAHAFPAAILSQRKPLTARPRPYATEGISFLPHLPRCKLVIVGGGHVGRAVAELAAGLDFEIWVVDDREEIIDASRFPSASRRIAGSVHDVLPKLEIDSSTYCLIVTRGHHHDEESLFYLAERGARYVGLIGSRRKIKMIFRDLLAQGISRDALAQVHAPLGIDIGSQTVSEIAVSIAAELVSHRNRGIVPGRAASVLDEIAIDETSSVSSIPAVDDSTS